MFEKFKDFTQDDRVKSIGNKVFNKKTISGVLVIIVVCAALRIGFLCLFEVHGTVQKVDGSKITVANILTTQTIDVGEYPITSMGIVPGDRIKITKNLSGQIISVRDENREHFMERSNVKNSIGQNPMENNKYYSRGKH
jgi:hypothetical protein